MATCNYTSSSEDQTRVLGKWLAELLPPGCAVALIGPLGAGKTRLVQAVAQACGVSREEVTSPTFILVQHYHGERAIHHADAYRLGDAHEFAELGLDETFQSDGLFFVEWADRVAEELPPARIEIRIDVVGSETREFHISSTTPDYDDIIAALAERISQSSKSSLG